MKILLLHPEDDPESGPWTTRPWDRVIDLGLGGENSYARWSQRFGCSVSTLNSFRCGFEDFRQVRRLLDFGCGKLIDQHGLDWWEIMSLLLHGNLETLVLLQRLVQSLDSSDEVYVSRPGLHANLLQPLLPGRLKVLSGDAPQKTGLMHYLRVSRKLSAAQVLDVFWDKYDAGYQFRGRFSRKPRPSPHPLVLLPTAYINVSRTGIAYAHTFSEEHFLLVTTRRSGWVPRLPRNVEAHWLSSYASVRNRDGENADMLARWRSLLKEMVQTTELEILNQMGYLDSFPRWLCRGFEVRDAWHNVLHTEPVAAVLCADDSNPYTRIPLLLAQARGLPNIACHHGALDGRYVFKRTYGDVVWAKGRMEEDYLVRKCGVPPGKVEIAAPALAVDWAAAARKQPDGPAHPYVIFFSESCEAAGGRQKEFYRDILPPLADLARAAGRKLIVKLHPAESEPERAALLDQVLSPEQRSATRLISGPLSEDLLAKAWFGITILSTVAMECAIRGIPCFLCQWLECWPFQYVEQFTRFGVGIGLKSPGDIARIPQYLEAHSLPEDVRENCWQPAPAGRLRDLLTKSSPALVTASRYSRAG